MKQLLQFKITHKTSRSIAIVRCKIDLTSGLNKKVTYYAHKNSLRQFALRTTSIFIKKLAITGTGNSYISGHNNFAKKIQQFLEDEFGNRFKVEHEYAPLVSRQTGFRPNFTEPRPLSKSAKKAKAVGSNSKKAKTVIDEEWSNFIGEQSHKTQRPRFRAKAEPKKPTAKKMAMKKAEGGVIFEKVAPKKTVAKKALAKKKVVGDTVLKKAIAKKTKKVAVKKTVTNKAASTKKAKKGEVIEKSDYNTIKVFYATDRKKTSPLSSDPYYSGKRNDTNNLEYGFCNVSVPHSHRLGTIDRPNWVERTFYVFPENPQKHISIIDLKIQTKEDFISDLMNKIGSSTDKDALIFIHGFNVSFEESIWRTAQIAYDLTYKGAPITYSWPSRGVRSKTAYMTDEQNVDWTVPHLKDFLINVLSDSKIEKLHLLAHSMGTRVLTKAVISLKETNPELTDRINQIILAAPDINATVFTDTIAPAIYKSAQQITLYASSKDVALYWSTRYRSEDKRAGQSGNDIVIVEGIETVDASKVDCNLVGHGYFAETQELINDIFHILKHSFTPPERNLKPVIIKNRGRFWQFPETK
jgi:esterase/lipase superfamily enzyme